MYRPVADGGVDYRKHREKKWRSVVPMNYVALYLRLTAAVVWAALTVASVVFDGVDYGILFFACFIGLALVPHRFLAQHRFLHVTALFVSVLPLAMLLCALANMQPVTTESIGHLVWLTTGLCLSGILFGLLPASLAISLFTHQAGREASLASSASEKPPNPGARSGHGLPGNREA